MPTKEELLKTYRSFDEEKLLAFAKKIKNYTPEAQQVFFQVLEEAGGIEQVQLKAGQKADLEQEITRVSNRAKNLFGRKKTLEKVKQAIQSELLNAAELEEIIDKSYSAYQEELTDKKVKPSTVIGGVIGGFIGGNIGGYIFGYLTDGLDEVFIFLIVGLAFNNYFFVWLFTRQSIKNTLVIIITAISVLYAFFFSQVIYEYFSYAFF